MVAVRTYKNDTLPKETDVVNQFWAAAAICDTGDEAAYILRILIICIPFSTGFTLNTTIIESCN